MEYELDVAKAQPSLANVNIISSYNENNNTVDITVSGERNEDFVPCEEWTNLTVLLVEDNVLGYQISSELSPNYPHNGVIRSNVSAVWGDLVEWNGDKYEMHYSAILNNAWNKDNLRIVAFLSKPFTGDNYDEINVVNCNELYLKDEQTGIHVGDVNVDGAVDVADIATIISVMANGGASGSLADKADVNGDGTVDVADIATVISIMTGTVK